MNRPKRHMSSIDLQDAFTTFNSQLLALLGVPVLPPSIRSSDAEEITDWQLDALIRQRALENIKESKETLQSIVSLVNQIQNMPVGQGVKGDIQNALNALDEVRTVPDTIFSPRAQAHNLHILGVHYRVIIDHQSPSSFCRSPSTVFACFLQSGYACTVVFSCGTYLCCIHSAFRIGGCSFGRCCVEGGRCLETFTEAESEHSGRET